jgi:Uma2 family endonuclease
MGEPASIQRYSIEEYLKLEENSIERMEYHDGEIFAMACGTIEHSLISNNIGTVLGIALRNKNKPCLTYSSDAKIAVNNHKFLYPDASVVCGNVETFPNMPQGISNPTLIVEVLSDSTGSYDRGAKFQAYQNIKTFQEYILISQDRVLVEVFFKPKNAAFWYYQAYKTLEEVIELKSIEVEVSLADIYFGLDLKSGLEM